MSQPRIVNWNWKRTIPGTLVLVTLFGVLFLALPVSQKDLSVSLGVGLYFLYSILSRRIISRLHRKGMKLLLKDKYHESIDWFRKSIEFFEKYPWLDKYRSVLMLSSSVWTYREMAMMNIAYAYSQMGEGKLAAESYKKILEEYPENKVARSSLRLMEAGAANKEVS